MQSPERIHPALWRATQLAQGAARTLPTGHAALSAELPDGGWRWPNWKRAAPLRWCSRRTRPTSPAG